MALTPRAAERVAREAAGQYFDPAARSLNADWGTAYDGKQIQRWGEHFGWLLEDQREQERIACRKGQRPEGPANAPELLVVGMDGGRVQEREKDPASQSRWREDKVLTVSSYRKGPPPEPGGDPEPVRLVTTYVGTMGASKTFGHLARVEAERRGIRQAAEVVLMGDGAEWIDTVAGEHFGAHVRILDYYHVSERLTAVAKALCGPEGPRQKVLAERLKGQLYQGKLPLLLRYLTRQAQTLGPPRTSDPEGHPRRVVAENLAYLERHREQMDYPRYRAQGWPIGSGVTESGVKLFNKRVKGTEQFWSHEGVEAMLCLRALWLSNDGRWDHYWLYGRLPRAAA